MDNYDVISDLYDFDMGLNIGDKDIPFYSALAKRFVGQGILELGCGTGRILIPLASNGYLCWGIDTSAKMLEVCEKKLKTVQLQHSCVLKNQDMRWFRLPRKFDMIISAFSIFTHLLTIQDQKACLAHVRDHLTSKGVFVLDVFCPSLQVNSAPDDLVYLDYTRELPDGKQLLRSKQIKKISLPQQINEVYLEYTISQQGKVLEKRQLIEKIRYFYLQELYHLFEICGFEVMETYGNYHFQVIDNNAKQFILLCRKASAIRG